MSSPQIPNDPQFLRERYIKSLDSAANPTQKAREMADDLFALDLTVYSSDYHKKQRGSWYGLNPVIRTVPNKKAYDRNDAKIAMNKELW